MKLTIKNNKSGKQLKGLSHKIFFFLRQQNKQTISLASQEKKDYTNPLMP